MLSWRDAQVTSDSPEAEMPAPRILLVEDSMIIALDAEECLLGMGAGTVAVHGTVAGALAELEAGDFDFALLDFNLGAETSEPVAQELKRRGIPFWIATGYSEMADQIADLGATALLLKPYGRVELEGVMRQYSAGDGAAS